MKSCNNCIHFLKHTGMMDVDVTVFCTLEFNSLNFFYPGWFQPKEYYSQPDTQCPHYREENKV